MSELDLSGIKNNGQTFNFKDREARLLIDDIQTRLNNLSHNNTPAQINTINTRLNELNALLTNKSRVQVITESLSGSTVDVATINIDGTPTTIKAPKLNESDIQDVVDEYLSNNPPQGGGSNANIKEEESSSIDEEIIIGEFIADPTIKVRDKQVGVFGELTLNSKRVLTSDDLNSSTNEYQTIDLLSKTEGAYIVSQMNKIESNASRGYAIFDISQFRSINIVVPVTATNYSIVYCYSNTLSGSTFDKPETIHLGTTQRYEETNINTLGFKYVLISYTLSGGVPSVQGKTLDPNALIKAELKKANQFITNSNISLAKAGIKPLKIGFFGNSFSALNVAPKLTLLLKNLGIKHILGAIYVGGGTIEGYYRDRILTSDSSLMIYVKYKDGVKIYNESDNIKTHPYKFLMDEEWDIISYQQGSASSGLYSTYNPYFNGMKWWTMANAQVPFKTMWFMPWPWSDSKIQSGAPNCGSTSNAEMYDKIVQATDSLLLESGDEIDICSRCGVTIEKLLDYYQQSQIWSDGQHLNQVGCVAAAITIVLALSNSLRLGISLDDIVYASEYGIPEADFNNCKTCNL